MSVSRVCQAAKLDKGKCGLPVAMAHQSKRSNPPISWDMLFGLNKEYAAVALQMALRYGYQRDPHASTLGDSDSATSPSADVFWYTA